MRCIFFSSASVFQKTVVLSSSMLKTQRSSLSRGTQLNSRTLPQGVGEAKETQQIAGELIYCSPNKTFYSRDL